jgi:hypothetical protein
MEITKEQHGPSTVQTFLPTPKFENELVCTCCHLNKLRCFKAPALKWSLAVCRYHSNTYLQMFR